MSRSDPHFKASCPLPPMTTIQVISMASFNKLSQVLSGGRHRLACVVQSLHSMAFKAYTQWLSRALPGLPHCDTLRRALRSSTPRPFPTQALPSRQPQGAPPDAWRGGSGGPAAPHFQAWLPSSALASAPPPPCLRSGPTLAPPAAALGAPAGRLRYSPPPDGRTVSSHAGPAGGGSSP